MAYDEYGALGNFGGVPQGNAAGGFLFGIGKRGINRENRRELERQRESARLKNTVLSAQFRVLDREHAHSLRRDAAEHSADLRVETARRLSGVYREDRARSASDSEKAAKLRELEKERPAPRLSEGSSEPSVYSTSTRDASNYVADKERQAADSNPETLQSRRDIMMEAATGSPESPKTRLV